MKSRNELSALAFCLPVCKNAILVCIRGINTAAFSLLPVTPLDPVPTGSAFAHQMSCRELNHWVLPSMYPVQLHFVKGISDGEWVTTGNVHSRRAASSPSYPASYNLPMSVCCGISALRIREVKGKKCLNLQAALWLRLCKGGKVKKKDLSTLHDVNWLWVGWSNWVLCLFMFHPLPGLTSWLVKKPYPRPLLQDSTVEIGCWCGQNWHYSRQTRQDLKRGTSLLPPMCWIHCTNLE